MTDLDLDKYSTKSLLVTRLTTLLQSFLGFDLHFRISHQPKTHTGRLNNVVHNLYILTTRLLRHENPSPLSITISFNWAASHLHNTVDVAYLRTSWRTCYSLHTHTHTHMHDVSQENISLGDAVNSDLSLRRYGAPEEGGGGATIRTTQATN